MKNPHAKNKYKDNNNVRERKLSTSYSELWLVDTATLEKRLVGGISTQLNNARAPVK